VHSTLVKKDEIDPQWTSFVDEHQIRHITFDMKGTKKESIPMHTMKAILDVVYDASNYPLLMHCNQGKHRTGCVVGVMRKLSGWSLPTVLDEYRQYAEPKIRECDVEYLTSFETNVAWQRELQVPRAPQLVNRTFLRALALTVVVVVIWLFSASRLSTANHGGTPL
jgi:tyrosine-protein phosphatase SIW14